MFKLEDMDEVSCTIAKDMSKEGSVIIYKLKGGSFAIVPGIEKDSPLVMSTESGLALSPKELEELEDDDYLFIPEGSFDKDESIPEISGDEIEEAAKGTASFIGAISKIQRQRKENSDK
jgi:hypothetical protein